MARVLLEQAGMRRTLTMAQRISVLEHLAAAQRVARTDPRISAIATRIGRDAERELRRVRGAKPIAAERAPMATDQSPAGR